MVGQIIRDDAFKGGYGEAVKLLTPKLLHDALCSLEM